MKSIPEINFKKVKENDLNGFEILVLEKLIRTFKKPLNHDPFRPHRLRFFAILIITEGEVNHFVDLKRHRLQAGDVMVIAKGQIHAFDERLSYKGYMILFTEAFMQKYMAQSSILKINHLYNYFLRQEKLHNPASNERVFGMIKEELRHVSPSSPAIVGALLSIYLLKLNEENLSSAFSFVNKKLDSFYQFKRLLEENYTTMRDAKAYASRMSISYKQLNEMCKAIIKTTAKVFIDNYVILEAKRKLVTTSLSVKEISFALGFDEPTNFVKYFKKQTKLTPAEFRNTLA